MDEYVGGDRYGLGEVRFATETVPEPATMIMLGLGGMSLLRRRKR
ncbi:MAG: PEP-CTERM sorting domain-containing protein [Phycisphaerae bacterium]|nr:PEP-CTERM sorting domain-containing protein [Phycisphaerae bacterium]